MDQFAEDTAGAVASYLNPDQGQPAIAARSAMQLASETTPDLEIELRRASQRTGVPLDAARDFPEEVKKEAAAKEHDFDEMAAQFPGTTKFLANPDNTRIVRDDITSLTNSEATIGPIVGPKPTFYTVAGSLLRSLPNSAEKVRDGLKLQMHDLLAKTNLFSPEYMERSRKDLLSKIAYLDLQDLGDTPDFLSSTAKGVYGGAKSTIRMAPALAAAVATRSTAPLLAMAGVQTEAEAYGKYAQRGATPGEALVGAVGEGAVEVATEMMPMGFLVKNMGKVGAGHFITGLLAREIPSEQLATLAQDAIDTAIANPDKTWAQYAAERGDAAYQTLLATITQASIMGGMSAGLQRINGQGQAAEHANLFAESLKQLNDIAAASKIRERDASTAQSFFQSLMQDGRDTVWITPQALTESGLLEQVSALPGVSAQLEQAAVTGAEIRIPIADLMANLSGPEVANSLIPHLADEPGGFTQTTANEYMQSGQAQELGEEVTRTLEAQRENDAFNTSRETVASGILEQLNAAGRFSPAVNQAYASMVASFYAVQGAKLGITPEEMAARYPMQVRAERMAGAKTLDQIPETISEDEQRAAKQAIYAAYDSTGAPADVVAKFALNAQEKTNELNAPMTLWESESGQLGLVPATQKSPFNGGKKVATIYPESTVTENSANTLDQASLPKIETRVTTDPIERSEDDQFMLDFATPKGPKDTTIRAVIDGKEVGYLDLAVSEDGSAKVREVKVDPEHRRKGIATALYNAAWEQGIDIQPGENMTPAGKAFRAAYDSKVLFQRDSMNQGERGSLSFADDITSMPSVISLFRNADMSTFLHESGHFFLEVMSDIASRENAPAEIRADMDAMLSWFGIQDERSAGRAQIDELTKSITFDDARALVGGKTEKPGGTDPVKQLDASEGNQSQLRVGRVPLSMFMENQDGVLYDGTVNPERAADYQSRTTEAPPIIAVLSRKTGKLNILDGGHRITAARARGDETINVIISLKEERTPLQVWDSYDIEQKRKYHEQFARGFEAYLFEGNAPTAELQGLFSRFRSWLINVYKSLTALDVELTPEVRGVFDRMLASADAIDQAQREEGFGGMFGSRPDFMTEEEWGAYRALNLDASQDAVHELQTRSLRDMQWLANARADILKKMQRENAGRRQRVREQVTDEIMQQPVNVARNFFGRGLNPDGTKADMHKLSIESMIEMYGGEGDKFARLDWEPLGYGKYGALATEGLSPDVAAELLGFESGDAMVREMLEAPPAKQAIAELTDKRMMELYGDLTDEPSIERAISQALHTRAHNRFLATELNALRKASGSPAILGKAAQAYAERIVRRTVVRELRPDLFTAAARRAARAADKAFKAGDIQEAAAQKQIQLINSYAAKAAIEAREEVQKTATRFQRIANGNNEKASKTRDMEMVQATRAILAEFGIGTRGAKAAEYLVKVQAYDPALAAILRDRIDAATANAKPINQLTVDELGALKDEVESLWFLAKRSRQSEVDGDLIDRQEIQETLRDRMQEIGIPETMPGDTHAITKGEVFLSRIQSMKAALRRVEAWADLKDGDTKMGPFRKFIWTPIKDAADAYRADKAKFLRKYRETLTEIAPTLTKTKIAAPELGYAFGYDNGGMGKMELLHAILHTGNAGNKKKLLLGRNWGSVNEQGELDTSKWDSFINRMITEGVLKKADFDFAQKVWDLLEEMKPAAQKTHRQVFGRYFDEVTADGFTTPWGAYKGGYVPAITDTRIVSDAKTRAIIEDQMNSSMNIMPSTSKGFTKSRVEYNQPLMLDLRLLSQHIDKVLLFTHLEAPVADVRRILGSDTVSRPLNRIDPSAYDGLLTPWLKRTALQQVETPIDGSNGTMRFFSVLRQRAGMAAMFANVSNTAQQVTGFSIAALKVKPKYLMSGVAEYLRNPREMAAAVAANSPYMANRMENEVGAMTGAINEILLNPGLLEQAQGWALKHTYFLQSAVDNVMGPIIWTGAYTQALETAPAGMSEPDMLIYARRLADSAVRETQGSTLPEDIARFETGNAFYRIFTQFAGYFNMQANILGTEYAKIIRQDTGLDAKAGKGLYVLMFGFLAPAWISTAIALAFRGGPDDEDKDGQYLDDWIAQTFGWGTIRSATALVPVVGQIVNAASNRFNQKPYDDRISTGAGISFLESATAVPGDIWDHTQGRGKATKTVRDVASLLSLISGLPVSGAARPLTYAVEVSGGAKPTGPVDAARGAITGVASPASKGR